MNLIFKIFCNDVKGLVKNLFALIVAGGLCVIPSLYAWFNIYSNWDPYGNTGAIKIAVYSADNGYDKSDGSHMDMGTSVIESLKENDKLGWVFSATQEEAVEGVQSGEYYAAIVIGGNFSQSMYEFADNGLVRPSVTYYENAKRNAVASKITQSGKSSLEESINSEFVNTVITTMADHADNIFDKDNDIVSKILRRLNDLNENLKGYGSTIDLFIASNGALNATLGSAADMLGEAQNTLSEERLFASKSETDATVDSYIAKFDSVLTEVVASGEFAINTLQQVKDAVEGMQDIDISGQLDLCISAVDNLISKNEALLDQLKNINGQLENSAVSGELEKAVTAISELERGIKSLLEMAKDLSGGTIDLTVTRNIIGRFLEQSIEKLQSLMDIYNNALSALVSDVQNLIRESVNQVYASLEAAGSGIAGLDVMINGLSVGMGSVDTTLGQIDEIITNLSEKLTDIYTSLENVSESERFDSMLKLLTRDSSVLGAFFASPVKVTTENVYEPVNYGTAVSPFYTTLALWVGGLLLTALIKVAPEKKGILSKAKDSQLYFGRYLLFFVMGQIQAVITVVGDLYLLKIQCMHPALFMLAASLTSFTFTLLIYTLTLSFGDVGKALAVVMVVIQIAGSSGTFPIELLPDFFQKVYLYFPFPYAINAMREAVSGMYQGDFWGYLGWLVVFIAGALLLGLAIRKPFVHLNHFMHKRMHDTEFM